MHGDGENIIGARGVERFGIDTSVFRPANFYHFVAEVLDVGADGFGVLRMYRFTNNNFRAIFYHALGEQHRLAQRGRAVIQRCVRDIESSQQALVRLVFENRLQCSLRDFRLVRRIRRQELGAKQELIDTRRLKMRVGAAAEKREVIDCAFVFRRQLAEPAARLDLRPWARDVEQLLELDVVRDRIKQTIDRIDADDGEHLFDVLFSVGDVSVLRRLGKFQLFPRFFFNVLFVLLGVHQLVHFLGRRQFHANHPAVAVRIGVDQLRLLGQRVIHFNNLARHRRE